jgi:hypothetical protein
MYQEGNNPTATKAFRLMALRSGGRYATFGAAIPETVARLSNQLNEIARFAVSTVAAIENRSK